MKIPLLPKQVSHLPPLPFIEGKSLRVLMKVKWMKAKGDGWEVITARFWWVRTHKLITWYWWRTSTRHFDTSTFTTSTSFGPFQTGKHKGVIQEQSSTQVTFKNSHKESIKANLVWWRRNQMSWLQKATRVCPPFDITPHLCNYEGKPLFEWVNIVITELLWNHAFLTRRADFSRHIQIAIFISITHRLQKIAHQTKSFGQANPFSITRGLPSFKVFFSSEKHSMSTCFLTVSLCKRQPEKYLEIDSSTGVWLNKDSLIMIIIPTFNTKPAKYLLKYTEEENVDIIITVIWLDTSDAKLWLFYECTTT